MLTNIFSTTVLKGKAIYGDLLLKEKYKHHEIDELAISEYVNYEHEQLGSESNLYLLAIKKILLYAIPVISSTDSTSKRGVQLTAQFNTNCIIQSGSRWRQGRLINGDRYVLIGFTFPNVLINNLDISVYELKYYQHGYESNLDISHLSGIEPKIVNVNNQEETLFMINTSYYETLELYNAILKVIKVTLDDYVTHWSSILLLRNEPLRIKADDEYSDKMILPKLTPFNSNNQSIIDRLNDILERKIDNTFTLSYYETMRATANWLLYDQIELYGFDSPIVKENLNRLSFNKQETLKVFVQLVKENKNRLIQSRAEKITREQFPFYFNYLDNRHMFTKFKRFNISMIAKKHRDEVNILLKKELEYQEALINNKCQHIELLKRLNMQFTNPTDSIKAFNDLIPFIDLDSKTSDSIQTYNCKNCKYPILCAHEMEFYEMIKERYSNIYTNSESDNDIVYSVKEVIVNRFKQTQRKIDHANVFSYNCKYCSKELGKSSDIIQVSIKSTDNSYSYVEDEYKSTTNSILGHVLTYHVNPVVLGIDKRKVFKLVAPIIRDHLEIVSQGYLQIEDPILYEANLRLSALILSLVVMISLNINILKTNQQLLIIETIKKRDSKSKPIDDVPEPTIVPFDIIQEEPIAPVVSVGGSIKTEFVAAYTIVKNSNFINSLIISDDKIRSMIIDYYKRIAVDIGDVVDTTAIARTNNDKIMTEITHSSIYSYLRYAYARRTKTLFDNISFDTIFTNKNSNQRLPINSVHNSDSNVYKDIIKPLSKNEPGGKTYFTELDYARMYTFLTTDRYVSSMIEEPLPADQLKYYEQVNKRNRIISSNPRYIIPEVTKREVSFKLANLNLIYCADLDHVSKHEWVKNKCIHCNIDYSKTSSSNNNKILNVIDIELMKDAFFELYTNNCPVKNIHQYDMNMIGSSNSVCTQCGITKHQIIDRDMQYYKKFISNFQKHRDDKLKLMIKGVNESVKTNNTRLLLVTCILSLILTNWPVISISLHSEYLKCTKSA